MAHLFQLTRARPAANNWQGTLGWMKGEGCFHRKVSYAHVDWMNGKEKHGQQIP